MSTSAKRRSRARTRLSRVIAGETPPAPLEHHDSLVEQYAAMAHVFQPRPVDHVLRFLDVVIAGVALVIASPLMFAIAVGMKLSSPRGPVLYRGWRVGRGGRRDPVVGRAAA